MLNDQPLFDECQILSSFCFFIALRGEEIAIQAACSAFSQMHSLLLEHGLAKLLLSCPCGDGYGAAGTIPYEHKEI